MISSPILKPQIATDVSWVCLAVGSQQPSDFRLTGAALNIDGFDHDRDLHVTPLDGCDIILGKTWLTHYSPKIDWEAKVVTVTLDGSVYRLSSPGLELPGHACSGIQVLSGI